MVTKRIPLPLGSNPARSRLASDTRVINGFIEAVQSSPKAEAVIYGAAGMTEWVEAGQICRGLLEVDGALFNVAGSTVQSITAGGAITTLSGIVPGLDRVIMCRNDAEDTQTLIQCNAGVFKVEEGVVSLVYEPDILDVPVVSVDWLSGWFIFALEDGRFFISAISSVDIDALDFATAEGDPDGLVRSFVLGRELLLMGPKTTEVWGVTGGDFPFSRLPGAVINVGLGAKHSICKVGSRAIFVDDKGIVQRMAAGYQVERVSNYEVERVIQALGDFSSLFAFSYTDKGHEFYVLSSDSFTWVFDQSTGVWTERKTGVSSRWQANNCVYFGGRFVVGSRDNPSLYRINDTLFDEDGAPLIFSLRLPVANAFPLGATVSRLEFDIDTGVGTEAGFVAQPITWDMLSLLWDSDKITMDQTIDHRGDLPNVPGKFPNRNPLATLRWSDDGGRSWKGNMRAELGRQGSVQRVMFNRLGAFGRQGRIFELSISASVFRAILGAFITAEPRAA